MMSLEQYMLQKLQEEFHEAAEPACKAVTFGLHDTHPQRNITNIDNMMYETIDVLVIFDTVRELGIMDTFFSYELKTDEQRDYYHRKVVKLIHYTFISEGLGRVSITGDERATLEAFSEKHLCMSRTYRNPTKPENQS